MAPPTDEDLVSQALRGDDDAFMSLVARHQDAIFRTAARFARGHHEIEDIAQETFLHAHRKLRQYRGDAPFEHWLRRIAARKCIDLLRSRRKHGVEVALDDNPEAIEAVLRQTAPAPSEAAEVLRTAMQKLKPEDQMILTLLELEERPVREIAGVLGWSESKVKVRAHRARRALRAILTPQP